MMEPIHTGRTNTVWTTYARIGFEAKTSFETTWPRYLAARGRYEEDFWELYHNAYRSGFEAIVFSALTLEALVYDFAARYLDDGFVERHLDKMDPVSKWVVATQLVSGTEYPRSDHSFELLVRLFRRRNSLVHAKSDALPIAKGDWDHEKIIAEINQHKVQFPLDVAAAVEAMILVPNKVFELTQDAWMLFHIPNERRPPDAPKSA